MRIFNYLVVALMLVLLSACGTPKTSSNNKDLVIETVFKITNNQGVINITPDVGTSSAIGDTDQKVTASPTTTTETPIDVAMEDFSNPIDNSKKEIEKTPVAVPLADATPYPAEEQETILDWYTIPSMRYVDGNNKMFTWLSEMGDAKGQPVTFVFKSSDCGDFIFVVEDTSKNTGADGNNSNYNQAYFFDGEHPLRPEEANNKYPGLWAPPGCTVTSVLTTFPFKRMPPL
jgi:hypothetical protein